MDAFRYSVLIIAFAFGLGGPLASGMEVSEWLRTCPVGIGLKPEYFPHVPGREIFRHRWLTTDYGARTGGPKAPTLVVSTDRGEVTYLGRRCRRTDTVIQGVTQSSCSYHQDGRQYTWSPTQRLWIWREQDPEPADGVRWRAISRLENGNAAYAGEENADGGINYRWEALDKFTIPQTGVEFSHCFRQTNHGLYGLDNEVRIYAPGIGLIYSKIESLVVNAVPSRTVLTTEESYIVEVSVP